MTTEGENPIQKARKCFLIESNAEALACIKEIVSNAEPSACSPKIVLLTQAECPYCEEEAETLASDIKANIIQRVDIASPYGKSIARKNDIDFAPAVLVLDCEDLLLQPPEND